ncbi:hypothetical protein, partial [Methylobacterium symbioticum]
TPAPTARQAAQPAAQASPQPAARNPAQARTEAPRAGRPAAGTVAGADKSGWLSDLLTRASLDEEEEAPARTGQAPAADPARALESISNDIGRMIDHRTAVDLWERYRRGESNLFQPRIYTAQGRQTFAEIQRRYRGEVEFRRAVDRYVGEFERLLGDVMKNDPDTRRADAYLTSETGKVYTMLAHASGRFEGA